MKYWLTNFKVISHKFTYAEYELIYLSSSQKENTRIQYANPGTKFNFIILHYLDIILT
jgi:hypothetical protein